MALLELRGITKRFGGLVALDDVSFSIEHGEFRGLIGPNGAGKSVMFKIIAGFYNPSQGRVFYQGQEITGYGASAVAELGLIRTFQETTLFDEFTVYQNVLVGCHLRARSNLFSALFGSDRERQQKADAKTHEVLEFMGLSDRKEQLASNLPLGSQRILAMAIALAAEPKCLLLDEPFAGLNAEETNQMMALVRKVRDSGITIVLVEHDMKAVMGLCEKIMVLDFGRLLAEGSPEEIRSDQAVIEAYLGTA